MLTACAVTLALLGAGDGVWTPYDRFNQADDSCEVRAAVPGPAGATLLGTSCNRLDGKPIGPVVAVDAAGKAGSSPFAAALAAALPDDRMQELSQLVVHGDGWVVTRASRAKDAPRVEAVNYPAGHTLTRIGPTGARDEAFSSAVKAALDERLGKSWGILDVAVDSKGRLLVGATVPYAGEDYLKDAPVAVLRFDAAGKVEAALDLVPALKTLGLGYFHVLTIRSRATGGVFVGGRFQKPGNARGRLFLVAFDEALRLDPAFNTSFFAAFGKTELEIRLVIPTDDGGLWAIGRYDAGPEAHVVRITAKGALDKAFKPFTLPGQYPQGRFLYPQEAGLGADQSLWVSHHHLPGAEPGEQARPGLVRLLRDGRPDAAVTKAMGKGLWSSTAKPGDEVPGWTTLLAPQPDGSVVAAGRFDRFDGDAVRSPVRLTASGKRDPKWAPNLSTEVPKKAPEPNATTSAFFKADGKPHYVACKKGSEVMTMMYVLGGDPWGHKPSCIVHLGGDMGSPGGAWQHCDARVRQQQAAGAKCAETAKSPLHDHRR